MPRTEEVGPPERATEPLGRRGGSGSTSLIHATVTTTWSAGLLRFPVYSSAYPSPRKPSPGIKVESENLSVLGVWVGTTTTRSPAISRTGWSSCLPSISSTTGFTAGNTGARSCGDNTFWITRCWLSRELRFGGGPPGLRYDAQQRRHQQHRAQGVHRHQDREQQAHLG